MKILYHIGRYSKLFRAIYHKLTRGRWLWGIQGYILDNPVKSENIETFKWIDDNLEQIFKVKK